MSITTHAIYHSENRLYTWSGRKLDFSARNFIKTGHRVRVDTSYKTNERIEKEHTCYIRVNKVDGDFIEGNIQDIYLYSQDYCNSDSQESFKSDECNCYLKYMPAGKNIRVNKENVFEIPHIFDEWKDLKDTIENLIIN